MTNDKSLQTKIKAILLREDPGGVYIKELHNEDEYGREIDQILILFDKNLPEEIFIKRICDLFTTKFAETGENDRYKSIARMIWNARK
jgi:hypothetical protein